MIGPDKAASCSVETAAKSDTEHRLNAEGDWYIDRRSIDRGASRTVARGF
jgi:hypothetical protein